MAIAVNSVYAIDPRQRIQTIERDSDGLRERTAGRGGGRPHIVREGDTVARSGLDGRVSALQRSPGSRWQDLHREARDLTPASPARRRAHALRDRWRQLGLAHLEAHPGSPWTPWESLTGFAAALGATLIAGAIAWTAPGPTGWR